jgi:hypothetical protein
MSAENAEALAILDRLRAEHDGWVTVVHELKCWPRYFGAVARGEKTCELRRDDRAPGFRVGDDLLLREWHPEGGYTGAYVVRRVTHVLRNAERLGLAPGFALLSLAAA